MYKNYPGSRVFVQIETKILSAAATYTSPSWAAGAYRQLRLEFVGTVSAFSYLRLQANADSATVYTDIGYNANSAVSADSAAKTTNGFARVGVGLNAGASVTNVVDFWPLTTGNARLGLADCMSDGNSATITNSMGRKVQFAYNDTATDITFITYSVTAATMTGVVTLSGVPS